MRRRRRRFARGGNLPYQVGPRPGRRKLLRNPYRRGGTIRKFHSGGMPGHPHWGNDHIYNARLYSNTYRTGGFLGQRVGPGGGIHAGQPGGSVDGRGWNR